jgi:Brp/Blh family beta-carotene 15,15'-monooxygenase
MYVLPFAKNMALIEITRFGTEKIQKGEAEIILENYIRDLRVDYDISNREHGVIPMSTASIESISYGSKWVKTGAGAGMIKPSTGYAFHALAQDALDHTEALKKSLPYVRNSSSSRFQFYDRLLLKILEKSPENGKRIFEQLFKHVPIKEVLRFLSEKSTIEKEVFIFSKLPVGIFMKTAIKNLIHSVSAIPPAIASFIMTITALILFFYNSAFVFWILLIAGFATIGLSHGAVDHLAAQDIKNNNQLFLFIVRYLLMGGLLGVLWFLLPDLALVAFILYSAWHFGQADFIEWRLKQGVLSFLWGMAVLLTIMFFHIEETVSILEHIPDLQIWKSLEELTPHQILYSQISITIFSLALTAYNKSKWMAVTLLYLLISGMLPLLVSFGIYFVGQHSFHGWRHLTSTLNTDSYQLWLKSLPFTIAGAFLITFFMLFNMSDYMGIFFILLSCISIPHVLIMHHFYSRVR